MVSTNFYTTTALNSGREFTTTPVFMFFSVTTPIQSESIT